MILFLIRSATASWRESGWCHWCILLQIYYPWSQSNLLNTFFIFPCSLQETHQVSPLCSKPQWMIQVLIFIEEKKNFQVKMFLYHTYIFTHCFSSIEVADIFLLNREVNSSTFLFGPISSCILGNVVSLYSFIPSISIFSPFFAWVPNLQPTDVFIISPFWKKACTTQLSLHCHLFSFLPSSLK